MRALTVVAHQKRAAIRKPSIDMDDGPPPRGGLRLDAITGLENETAGNHRGSLRLREAHENDYSRRHL